MGPADDPDARPFPSEAEWLSLPAPSSAELPHDAAAFRARVLAALADERAVDAELQRLERELPPLALRAHEVPPPSPDFAARTLAAVNADRRDRWQRLLARYVAPAPSSEFVARTLAALRVDGDANASRSAAKRSAATQAAGSRPAATARADGARTHWPWPLLAAAALLLLWLFAPNAQPLPFEARLAATAPAAFTHHHQATPLAAVLAARHRHRDTDGLPAASADALWLQLQEPR